MPTIDIAKLRTEAEAGTDPANTPEALKWALVQFGFMRADQSLDELPDTITVDD